MEQLETSSAAAVAVGPAPAEPARPRLWNRSFFLLWQGQLVSALGDVVYGVALGFWVLEKTGSTALMGTLMAVSTLPRIVVSPFAGVIVDRFDRKLMLIIADAVRGAAVVLVGVAAFSGTLEVWMVFAAGIVIGLGSAFFNPAVSSAIPDIVPPQSIVQANSAFAMLGTGSSVAGNVVGGFVFQLLGAPLLFLANGISYLFAAAAALPIRVPKVRPERAEFRFFRDLAAGFRFVWQYRGIRVMFMTAALLNFFAVMGITLILPLFQRTPALGSRAYGVVMASLAGGLFAGFALTSAVRLEPRRRFTVFYLCGVASMAVAAFLPVWLNLPAMIALAAGFGVTNAILNSLLGATLQTAVPPEMRGKAFSLLNTLAGGLTPLAFAAGGALAEVVPMKALISASFGITLLCFAPLALSKPVRRLVNYNPETDTLEVIK